MGASCGHLEVHGASDGRKPPLCSQTVGPFACLCVPKETIVEGTQVLEVGSTPGKLLLRPKEDGRAELAEQLQVKEDSTREVTGTESEQLKLLELTAGSKDSPKGEGLLPKVKHWMQDSFPLKGWKGAHVASYLHPLAAAVLGGRLIEACKLIEEMEVEGKSPQQFFNEDGQDRIRRVGNKYRQSLEELKSATDNWLMEDEVYKGPRVQVSVKHGMLQVVSCSQHKDFEMLRAFAALCEVDVLYSYTEPDWARERVEEFGDRADESFWHFVKERSRRDHILQTSHVDALDEELKMLWVCTDGQSVPTVPPADSKYLGVDLPEEEGSRRTSGITTCALVPLKHASRTGLFRLIVVNKWPLSTGGICWYSVVPRRRYFQKQMCKFLDNLKFAAQSEALLNKMEASPRAAFYAQVRRHMVANELKKKPTRNFSKTQGRG